MQITIARKSFGQFATLGDLSIDGLFECHTLEDRVREARGVSVEQWKIQGQTAIPAGTYKVTIDFSNRFQRMMPHVLDVPGFTGIRIHKGNTDKDTEGCILLGKLESGPDMITHSTEAFEAFFEKLQTAIDQAEEVWIKIG